MSNTLYRKYRPQIFAEVISQNHVKTTLANAITMDKVAHAYLFAGPRGIGKTTLARILAKALNCNEKDKLEPCTKCSSCLEIAEGRSLDLIEIDAASNRGINEIRELREQVRVSPSKEKFKVFIIDEVHMLTNEAFNALLKTLEEPPAHAIFILATTEIHKIPETIISRCQRFDFKKIPIPETVKHLEFLVKQEGIKVEKKVIENIARFSQGYLRDAISMLGQILSLGTKEVTLEQAALVIPRSDLNEIFNFIINLFKGNTKEAINLIHNYIEEGGDIEFFTREVIEYSRIILLSQVTNDWQKLLWEIEEEALNNLKNSLENIDSSEISSMIEYLLVALTNMKSSEIIQLPLELAVIKITKDKEDDSDNQESPSEKPNEVKVENKPEEKVEDKVEEKTEEIPVTKSNIKISKVIKKWPQIIKSLKEYNQSLSSFLKTGKPLSIEGNKLIIGFKYAFHLERVQEDKNKKNVEEVLNKLFDEKLLIDGIVDESIVVEEVVTEKKEEIFDTVMNELGGEVVN